MRVRAALLFALPGLACGGGGSAEMPRDMARLGELVLRGGRAGERQVVSREWLEGSFARAAGPIDWPRPVFYGRLWWLFPPSGPATTDVLTASGAGGQWIFVVPPLELVVVFTADQMNPRFFAPMDMLFGEILAAVRG